MTTFRSCRFWRFSILAVALLAAGFAFAQAPLDPPVKPSVAGKFVGNGKNAAIKFITVRAREAFSDKEAIELIFSEKDPAGSKRPSMDAMFGKLGSALVLSVHHDGGIFGCEVSHGAHEKRGFSSVGTIKMAEFKLAGGNVSGRVITGKELDTFGEKWEVDLTFAAPLPEGLRNPPAPKPAAPAAGEPANPSAASTKPSVLSPKPAGPRIAAQTLPLPKDAAGVDFKAAVEQVHFTCPRPAAAVAKDFAAALKQQGWKDGAGSLMGKTNSILKREKGDAKLTIMIQPAGAGSAVKIFAEGLDWTGAAAAPTSAPAKAGAIPSVEDIEAEANKAIKDALKNLPKGF